MDTVAARPRPYEVRTVGCRSASACTFRYSIRPGTPTATIDEQLPEVVVRARSGRLVALGERIAAEDNAPQLDRTAEVLVATVDGKKDDLMHRPSDRAEDARLAHFSAPGGSDVPRPGDVVTVDITRTVPHVLLAGPTGPPRIHSTRVADARGRVLAGPSAVPTPSTPEAGPRAASLGPTVLRVRR